MSSDKLRKVDAAVSSFIHKASKKNEPLEAFRETDDFKQMETAFEDGIQEQVGIVAGKLPSFVLDDELDEDRLDKWLEKNLPSIADHVSEDLVLETLIKGFVFSVQASYGRLGIVAKASGFVTFELTNQNYIDALVDQANYLLNKSSIDETTRARLITLIRDSRMGLTSLDELATIIEAEFEGISATRAFMIANTEANQAMSTAQQAFLKENGFKTKVWIPAGPNTCSICQGNADDGAIPLDDDFSSGDPHPPGHPGCECYEDAGDEIDLDDMDVLWDGS